VRYLKITLIIGFAVSIVVGLLYEAGAFRPLNVGLSNLLERPTPPPLEHSVPQFFLFILLAFGIAWATIDINRPPLKIVVAASALLQVLIMPFVLNLYSVFFSPFPTALAVALSFGAAFAYSRSDAGKRKRMLRSIFGQRLSKKTFKSLVDASTPLHFQGALREATIVVCEIFNHDILAETLPVRDYVAMTNQFLETGADFLVEHDGYLDECGGESLRVIFGAAIEDPQHASKACGAALALAERLEKLNEECEARWKQRFDFRIGLNSGEVVIAAYGSKRLGSFSVAGETVEFARRLCSANLIYGSMILVGPETYALAASSIEVRPIELIRGKTPNSREEIYELMAMKDVLSAEELKKRDLFWKGIVYYREQQWEDALEYFQSSLTMTPADAPVEFYIRRIEHQRTGTPLVEWENARI